VRRLLALLGVLVGVVGCHSHGKDGEHDHPHGDEAAKGAAPEEEGPSLAITRWTDRAELFVELPAPEPNKPVPYHAHITHLADFQAATKGIFRVRWKTGATVAAEGTQDGVKRPGIFVFEAPAPGAGTYTLEMEYELDGKKDVFDCGQVVVASPPQAPEVEEPSGAITFLKETQWKIPFATAWAEERSLAREIELPAVVEPAGGDQLTIAAPTGGRFFHNPKRSLAEGVRVAKGDVVGSISPTVAGDDYNRLTTAVEEARLAKEQLEREIARIEPMVQKGVLPERRLIELRNELETETARLRSAGGRLGRVTAPGGEGGLAVKSTLDGVISEVLAPNGEPVDGGAPLVRIGGTDHLWLRARFVMRPAATLAGAVPTGVRLPGGARIELAEGARFVSPAPVVDPRSRVATWIVDVPGTGKDVLRSGSSAVVLLRVGNPENVVAVPRDAVIEINTRPYVFVQVDGEHFVKRAVERGRADGAWVQIVSGVAKGERVVTRGAFDVHLAATMGTVESHRH
jgi:cobalt-zinc-cadmium efflux system membrane fusion protein